MTREEAYYNSELILLDYCIWQNLDNQAKETLIEGVQIGIDQIYDQHEAELTAHKAKIEELEKSRLRWLKLSDEFNAELKAKDERIAELEEGAKNTAEIYAKQLAAKDKKITELEVKLDRFCGLKKRGKNEKNTV